MNLEIINPLERDDWDELVGRFPAANFFHTQAWVKVLHESYGYAPRFFVSFQGGRLSALVPITEIGSVLTGRRGVALPFTDFCPILLEENFADPHHLWRQVLEYGRGKGWRSIEVRGEIAPSISTPSATYFHHRLPLAGDVEGIRRSFRTSTVRNIRKAVREGVEVVQETSLESMREFYRLNCVTRREHGLPPQPFNFFRKVHEHIICQDKGSVVLAKHGSSTVAGAVFFHFGKEAIYKFGASDRRYQQLRANNLVMWEAIRSYAGSGLQSFSFGRTEPENTGLRQFKSGWGTEESQINYYRYDLTSGSFVQKSPKITGWHNRVFNLMPLPLLQAAGRVLYRHMG